MPAAIALREDYSSSELRRLATLAETNEETRRLLALAAVRDGMSREAAALIGGMDRQTLRDWVHAFNAHGPGGLANAKAPGRQPKLSAEQKAEVVALVAAGPNAAVDGVVRWRCVDLRRIIAERFSVNLDEVSIGRLLKAEGFSHISARPRHPAQEPGIIEAFKKTSSRVWLRR